MFDMLKMLYFWPLSQFTNWVIAEVGGDGRSQETSFCLVRSCSSPARAGRGGRLSQSEARTESRRPMRGRGRPVPLTVTLNAGMTEWGVLLQKSLDIKVAKTHIWRISSLWAAVSLTACFNKADHTKILNNLSVS